MAGNTATLKIKADSTGIRKGTDDLKRLDKQAGRTERTAKRLGRAFGTMAKFGAIAAVGIAGVFARSVIRNTKAQQDAVAQLNASLKSTGRYTDEASESLRAQAAALQQVTTYGDEAIITLQSQLLTFKQLGGEVLPAATEAVLDLATKMGGDLKGAAVLVGKALNDPATGLSYLTRVGITFSESQIKVIKGLQDTNQLAKAQAVILAELQTEFGGSARAARETLGGAIEAVKNNFGDLLEVSGDDSKGVVKSLNDLADTLARPEVKEGFATLAADALSVAGAFAKLPALTGFWKDNLKEMFGIIDNDNVLRLQEQLHELNQELRVAEGDNFFGFTWEEKAKVLRGEIIAIQKLLDAQAFNKKLTPEDFGLTSPYKPEDVVIDTAGGTETGDPDAAAAAAKKRADDEIKRLADRARATDNLRDSLREFAAEQGGPVVEAQQRYENALAEIDAQEQALLKTGGLTKQQESDLQDLREAALITRQQTIDLINEETQAIEDQLSPAQQVIADLELEIELQGLSNTERQKRIALIYAGKNATAEEIQQIKDGFDTLAANDDVIEAMDAFRTSAADAFVSIADGSKSAKDAMKDFLADMRTRLLRMIAEKLIEKAFGAMGSSGTGSSGAGFASFFSSLFASGRASGGPVSAGTPYPELIIPKQAGQVISNEQLNNVTPINKNQTTNITVNLPPSVQRRSAQQVASEVAVVQKRASSRNS